MLSDLGIDLMIGGTAYSGLAGDRIGQWCAQPKLHPGAESMLCVPSISSLPHPHPLICPPGMPFRTAKEGRWAEAASLSKRRGTCSLPSAHPRSFAPRGSSLPSDRSATGIMPKFSFHLGLSTMRMSTVDADHLDLP